MKITLAKVYVSILVVILVGVAFQAPISVLADVHLGDSSLIAKAWKEILLSVAGGLLIVDVVRRHQVTLLYKDWLLRVAYAYTVIHLVLLWYEPQGAVAAVAGLMIDLRHIALFVVLYIALQLRPPVRSVILKATTGAALCVLLFALLQVTALPKDFLALIGYSKETIMPYLTIDQNHDYVRISSTLRGPNPLGAYAVVVLSLVGAYFMRHLRSLQTRTVWLVGILLFVTAIVALWFSYSRSAAVAAVIAAVALASMTVLRQLPRTVWIVGSVVLFAVAGGFIAARDTPFVSQVILHETPNGGSIEKSNDEHLESLSVGVERTIDQPLGAGIGSTGSASLHGDDPIIIENQYLFIAHEVGWVGVAAFLVLFVGVLLRLFRYRNDWLALGLLASGCGLAAIGLLLPVWVDDTVAMVWWGLAGVAIGSNASSHSTITKRRKA